MNGQKRELELKQIERPIIAYSLCFDDVMRTYLYNAQIPYWHAFGACWEFCYDPTQPTEDSVSFPTVGYKKYEAIGIKICKYPAENKEKTIKEIKTLLSEGKIVPIHYDGYDCPWDKLQKRRRWHNLHTVLVRGTDKRGRNWIVDDPYYLVRNKRVPVSAIGTATKFYISIDTVDYRACAAEDRFRKFYPIYSEKPIISMEKFLADIMQKTENGEGFFNAKWIRTMENGFMSRHYLWLFFHHLREETGLYDTAELLLFSDLQLWKECVIHSLKGVRKRHEREHQAGFIHTFKKIIEREREILSLLHNEKTDDRQELISSCVIEDIKESCTVDLHALFHARGCKQTRRDPIPADITGEGEYIVPFKKFLKRVVYKDIAFEVKLGAEYDHFRCASQTVTIKDSARWKGMAFLVCSEWGCSQFLIKLIGRRREYLSDCIINDFTNPDWRSVKVGSSYIDGKLFQERVYFQVVCFRFPSGDKIHGIQFPDCPSAHVFAAVFIR